MKLHAMDRQGFVAQAALDTAQSQLKAAQAGLAAARAGQTQSSLAQGFTRFIELGPGTALAGFMKRIDKSAQMLNVADLGSLEATVKALSI